MKKLTEKQRQFAYEYLVDLNATQAAIRAGYSPKRADVEGCDLLKHAGVSAFIEELKRQRSQRVQFSSDDLLEKLRDQVNADLGDLFNRDGTIKPIHEWPTVWRQGLVRGIESEERYERGEGGTKVPVGRITKIKFGDRARILELIGKHTKVNAFGVKGEHPTGDAIDQFFAEIMGNSIRPKIN
ncbi:terminase small subunit [Mesorhizobium sp. M0217]|uniref:terminase small subunit n=1 Tax=unclassified Mesorhizobium TaxID=325217 RepID=UPI00333C5284